MHCSPTLHPAGVVAGGARVVGQSLERCLLRRVPILPEPVAVPKDRNTNV